MAVHGNNKLEVHPAGHRGAVLVDASAVHPWWAQNPDLKILADSAVEEAPAPSENPQMDLPVNEPPAPPEPVTEEPELPEPSTEEPAPPEPIVEEPEPEQPMAAIAPIPKPPVRKEPPAFNLPLIIKDHTQPWIPVYQEMQELYRNKAENLMLLNELNNELQILDQQINEKLASLETMGVCVDTSAAPKAGDNTTPFYRTSPTPSGERGSYGELRRKFEAWANQLRVDFTEGNISKKTYANRSVLLREGPGIDAGSGRRYLLSIADYGILLEEDLDTGEITLTLK